MPDGVDRPGVDPTGADFPAADCPACGARVPAGNFCGLCGSGMARPGRLGWLRPGTFGAAPGEPVALPALASSLFPHLPGKSRLALRVGLALIAAGLVGFAALRLPTVMITIGALGLPLLFMSYVLASQVYRDLPQQAVILAVALGAALGVGWALLAGRLVGHAYGLPMTGSARTNLALSGGTAAATIGALLMAAPAVVARLLPAPRRETLDGFVIGALGALAFTATATLTRFAPQVDDGVVADARPVANLLVQAGVCGVAIPLTAAVAGGVVGLALWFTPRSGVHVAHLRSARAALWFLAALVLAIYLGAGLVDDADIPQVVMMALHVALALAAVLVLRAALQIGLLHETPNRVSWDPLLCEHCEHVVPDAAFCPACGAATRASSQASRRFRRRARPVPVGVGGGS